jgi:hypothetical protein
MIRDATARSIRGRARTSPQVPRRLRSIPAFIASPRPSVCRHSTIQFLCRFEEYDANCAVRTVALSSFLHPSPGSCIRAMGLAGSPDARAAAPALAGRCVGTRGATRSGLICLVRRLVGAPGPRAIRREGRLLRPTGPRVLESCRRHDGQRASRGGHGRSERQARSPGGPGTHAARAAREEHAAIARAHSGGVLRAIFDPGRGAPGLGGGPYRAGCRRQSLFARHRRGSRRGAPGTRRVAAGGGRLKAASQRAVIAVVIACAGGAAQSKWARTRRPYRAAPSGWRGAWLDALTLNGTGRRRSSCLAEWPAPGGSGRSQR